MDSGEHDFLKDLLNNLGEGVYFTDRARKIIFWNKAAEQITGYRQEEVLGSCCSENLLMHVDSAGCQLCLAGCPLTETLSDGKQREMEVYLHHRDGHRLPVRVRVSPLKNQAGEIVGAAEVFSGDAGRKVLEERLVELERLALVDPLTGLANRRFIESTIRSRLEELRRNNWAFGILFIDIDNFKRVNDSFGHEVGDKVLRMVGRTLNENSRYFDTVGRWGGEEFVAAIANTHSNRLLEIAERFRALVERSMIADREPVGVTISVGAVEAQPDDTLESLLVRADKKLYMAKQKGRNQVCI